MPNSFAPCSLRCPTAIVLIAFFIASISNRAGDQIAAAEPAESNEPAWTSEQLESFEKHVRPLLIKHCYDCHGPDEQEGSFRADSRHGLLTGGDTGPAIVPGKPEDSELILAISYDPDGYQMPPSGKLADEEIAILTNWVRDGAAWPHEHTKTPAGPAGNKTLARDYWSLQPIQQPQLPTVSQPKWIRSPVDQFILKRLELADLTPAQPASKEVLLRRASYDLLGLPPTVEQRQRFLADDRPDAFAHLIDELLASPHYGERWGRHWLDLVRFAETLGHEFDFEIPLAWKYRDYVIRAINADLPIDQFAIEHLAGDLLENPRRNPETGDNESILGTGFLWFGQGKHSPVDIRAEQCDLIDNQIDVLTKTFLATTVACARCHDHKFDPITIKDYYAMGGILESSRRHYADLRDPAPIMRTIEQIAALKQTHRRQLLETAVDQLSEYVDLLAENTETVPWDAAEIQKLEHPLHAWSKLRGLSDEPKLIAAKNSLLKQMHDRNRAAQSAREQSTLFAEFSGQLPAGWITTGQAFSFAQTTGEILCGADPWKPVESLVPGQTFHSGLISGRTAGTLRSPTFVITEPFIDYHFAHTAGKRLSGEYNRGSLKNGNVNLVIDGFQHIRNPIYGRLSFNMPVADQPTWQRQDVRKWIGHRAYIEIFDEQDGAIQLDEIRFSQGSHPQQTVDTASIAFLETAQTANSSELNTAFVQLCQQTVTALHEAAESDQGDLSSLTNHQIDILNWLLEQVHSTREAMPAPDWLDQFYVQLKTLESALGTPRLGLTTTEGSPIDSPLLIRGNPGKPAAEVPRRFLTVLGGTAEQINPSSSGRLELARAITADDNPLFDRAMVNRVWKYHFGRGLVASPDDFGRMGQLPSHPELLDFLALEFRNNGRSLKWLHKYLMNSATYEMSSDLRPEYADADPQNLWWHRMNLHRLEGEAIRDSLLALSGRMNSNLYGASVAPHLTPFMLGRGRPRASGPLDGNGRRSIYINVRRNFLTPLFLAFDYPLPLTTAGRRSVSNVPAQALTLMNNEFTVQQSRLWAEKLIAGNEDTASRIEQLYLEAFCRLPTENERAAATQFVNQELNASRSESDTWADLCHVIVNVKEFVFIR